MRCGVYARRSTDEHQAASLEVQREEAKRYIDGKGWTLAPEHVYVDDAISRAEFKKRPALIAMLNAAAAKAFDVVVARDESRLGGDTYRTGIVIQDLLDTGTRLYYYYTDEEVSLDGAIQKFLVAARSFAAELEREKTSQRTHEHLLTKARRGLNVGGRVFGYDNVKIMDGDRHVCTEYRINEQQAEIVREIFGRYVDGDGVRGIAKRLNERGVPSPRAGGGGTGSWAPSVIWTILRRERYAGQIVWGALEKTYRGGTKVRVRRDASDSDIVRVEAPHLRIVSDALWRAAKSRMGGNRTKPWVAPRGRRPSHLLTGLARCAECGGGMKVHNGKLGTTAIKVYLCAYHHERGRAVCKNSLRQPIDEIDSEIIAQIEKKFLDEDFVLQLLREVRRRIAERTKTSSGEIPELERKLAQLRAELSNLAEAVAVAKGGIPSLVSTMEAKNEHVQKLQGRLAALRAAPDALTLEARRVEKEALARLKALRALMKRTPEDARKVIESLLDQKLTFTPVPTFRGMRYQVEGSVVLGGALQALPGTFAPECLRPQGDSNPR